MKVKAIALSLALFGSLVGTAARAAEDQMIFAVDVIRHGDRAPINAIPKAPYTVKLDAGQLSPTGMKQEYDLGTKLRERYITQNHLLPESYNSETMMVRASDVDRTLMSAQCCLMGLYPPGTGPSAGDAKALPNGYQPIPIHTMPRKTDSLLIIDYNPKLNAVLDQYAYGTPEYKERSTSFETKIKHWNEVTGMSMVNLRGLSGLGDALYIYKLHNMAVPKELTDDEIKEIEETGEWAFGQSFKPHQVGDLTSTELLKSIADYFSDASKSKNKLKYVLYSAHDTTISGLLSKLRDPVDRRPPYASDLNFTLFKSGEDYKVKMNLNGKPVAAPGFKDGEGSLKDFVALVDVKD